MTYPRRRVITGIDSKGRSCVTSDEAVSRMRAPAGHPRLVSSGYLELAIPLRDLNVEIDPPHDMPMVPSDGGILVKEVSFPPLEASPRKHDATSEYYDAWRGAGMHATPTLDLVVVLEGSIDLVLEVERVRLNTGDALIQRGTWHSWDNNSNQVCRLLVVNIARA
jgi:hypothetical protein